MGYCFHIPFSLFIRILSYSDADESVIEKDLNALAVLAELAQIKKLKIRELVEMIAPLLCHPNIWVRYGAVGFISSSAKHLPLPDVICLLNPIVRPFLKNHAWKLDELYILENLKSPISRPVYNQAIAFASKNSSFLSPRDTSEGKPTDGSDRIFDKLRSLGLHQDDSYKLISLRRYILKSAENFRSSPMNKVPPGAKYMENGRISLKDLSVTTHTVFLTPIEGETMPDRRELPSENARIFLFFYDLNSKVNQFWMLMSFIH